MRRRIAAIALLAVGLMLALAGCTFFAPQATLIPYDASDGVSLNVGSVQLRNAFVVSPHGTDANFVGALINSSDSSKTVRIQYTSHSGGGTKTVTDKVALAPNQVISYGDPGVPQLVFTGAKAKPGSLLRLFVQYGAVSGKSVRVPVLEGWQSAYKNLAPSPTPTPTGACSITNGGRIGCATSSPTPTPTSTPVSN